MSDREHFTHFAPKTHIMEAMVNGVPVEVLCEHSGRSDAIVKYAQDATAPDCPKCIAMLKEMEDQ